MEEPIKHEGIVESVVGKSVRVRIVQTSACSACHAKSMCTASETMVKMVDAEMLEPMQVGDRVMVELARKLGYKAVILAFVLPLLLMGAVIMGGTMLGWSETWAGTAGLLVMLPYYSILMLLNKRMQKEYRFTARKIN